MAASRVACASFDIGSSTTITITRDKSTYTHTITYKFGSATGTIATKTSNTSIAWNPTASTLYAQIPTATRRSGTITCQTYDGNTLVGTTTATFYASAVKEDCIPDVSATIVDTNEATIALTGDSSKMICYISQPKVTMTTTPKNSASIVSKQIYNPVGLTTTESPYTFDTVYSDEFIIRATDSRGYSNEKTYKVGFVEYSPCFFNVITLKRTESTSTTAKLNISGYCFKGNFGAASNTLTIKYRYKTTGNYGNYVTVTPAWKDDGTFTASADVPNLSLTEQYTFEVIVQDKLTSFGDGEEIVLAQGMGDIRITKDYIMTKNNIVIGDKNNTNWKGIRIRRKLGGSLYAAEYGVSAEGGAIQYMRIDEDLKENILGKIVMKEDGYLYNFFSNMSVAEIMSTAPSMATTGNTGYFLLNGGGIAPILVQWGRVHITPTAANTNAKVQVYFPYQYQGLPIVFTEKIASWSGTTHVSPEEITSDGVKLSAIRDNTSTIYCLWVAIGNGTNAMPE